ncbi:MAG: response regulator transcription factor [Saprospiraceae bacterium]
MQKPKVLIVDDEPNIVLAIDFLLSQKGFEIEKAYNGTEALEKLNSFKPNLIVLDVMMPGMTGFEVAKKIRTTVGFSDIQIVFLTAKGTTKDKMQGYSNGGDLYLTKPFDNDKLVMTIEEIIQFG